MRVKIKEAITKKVLRVEEVSPAVWVDKCDNCAKLFKMVEFCNEVNRGQMSITFDTIGYETGNTASFTVCSLFCAAEIFAVNWEYTRQGESFKRMEAKPMRADKMSFTSNVTFFDHPEL